MTDGADAPLPDEPAPDAVLLAGLTASGKTDWALALAERWPVEIVSVDSAQVYRGFDVGAAKPSAALQARVPHHLLDIRDPTETYSAGEFAADAHAELGDYARARGIERLYATGTLAGIAVERFGAGARWFPDGESLARTLETELEAGVRVLVKGSRMNRLERVVEAIAPATPAGGGTPTSQVK